MFVASCLHRPAIVGEARHGNCGDKENRRLVKEKKGKRREPQSTGRDSRVVETPMKGKKT